MLDGVRGMFAIKAEVSDPKAESFAFRAQKARNRPANAARQHHHQAHLG